MNTKIWINDEQIAKYLNGEASPEEAIQIEAWKKASTENQQYFDGLEQTYHLAYGNVSPLIDKDKVWQDVKRKSIHKKTRDNWWQSVAAVLILGLVSVLVLLKNDKINPNIIIAQNHKIHQKLLDKSVIELEKNGTITLNEGFGMNNRKLSLDGKAKFEVIHDDRKPFIVEAKGVYIEDVGTVFTVESLPGSDTVFVVVNEGIVRLYDDFGAEIVIKAGEKAWYLRSEKKIITSLDTKVVKFDFIDSKLKDVIQLLSKTYDADIQLKPNDIGDCTITTQFFDEELATIITIITETMGFKYEYNNHQYIITGKPCKE